MGSGSNSALWEGKDERKHLEGIHPGVALKAVEVSLYLVPALRGSGANLWPRAWLEPSERGALQGMIFWQPHMHVCGALWSCGASGSREPK